jgi:hypothetical protein
VKCNLKYYKLKNQALIVNLKYEAVLGLLLTAEPGKDENNNI